MTVKTSIKSGGLCALLLGLLLLGAHSLLADDQNPGIAPPDSRPYGKSYGQWGAEWWKWVIGIPPAGNPVRDTTGEFGDVDQDGPVWFLAGNEGGTSVRTLTVPPGKALFFPILNVFWGCPSPEERAFLEDAAVDFLGLDPEEVADLSDVQLMRLVIGAQMDRVTSMSCTIDGVAVRHLRQYRAASPVFTLEDLDFFEAKGECSPVVADGYWLMLAPLRVGQHTIRFTGVIDEGPLGSFALDVTYHLTVAR